MHLNNKTPQLTKHFSDQYLNGYAEVEAAVLTQKPLYLLTTASFNNVLIIPAYNESPEFLLRLQQHPVRKCVFILVINSPDDTSNADCNNLDLYKTAQSSGNKLWESENIEAIAWANDNILFIVDRFSDPKKIPKRQGVGLARKIACDIAIRLIQQKIIDTTFIHSTDADAELPENYFSQTENLTDNKDVSAAVYEFSHTQNNTEISEATHIYELSMRYYVDGLRWSHSPYAFHTIGSCLAISAKHYCQARGFPKKSGGEDFYLLNKLAKLGKIYSLIDKPILIASRESDRVPFGTGPAISKIINSEKKLDFPAYHPEIFVELKKLLRKLISLSVSLSASLGAHEHENKNILHCEEWLNSLSLETKTALESLEVEQLFQHLLTNCKNSGQMQNHINGWFDGFRTLKYIHHLQQHRYQPIPLSHALKISITLGF